MAGRMRKEPIVSLVPTDIEEQFDQGVDPRESMTPEQIKEFMKREADQLAKRIGKFVTETPKPDTSKLEEEEEETETFTIDLEKKTVEQKVDAIIVGDEGLVDKVMAVKANPYTDLVTSVFVSKALGNLIKTIRKEQEKLEDLAEAAATGEQAKALREVSRAVYDKQVVEIRSCWIQGTNEVKFDKIPEWAQNHIKTYVNDRLRALIEFSED